MRQKIIISILLTAICSCAQPSEDDNRNLREVGDIYFDEKFDDPNFKVCDESSIFQYYNFGNGLPYKGEKAGINQHFTHGFKAKFIKGESGFLTIRFIVNCEGKTGRFRIEGMDYDYKEKQISKNIVDKLLQLTKELDGWKIGDNGTNKLDYYQYLTFKLENGKLIEIMP